jgi:hypothetical protein
MRNLNQQLTLLRHHPRRHAVRPHRTAKAEFSSSMDNHLIFSNLPYSLTATPDENASGSLSLPRGGQRYAVL